MAFDGKIEDFQPKNNIEVDIENLNDAHETFTTLRGLLQKSGFVEYTNVNQGYKSLDSEKYIVRREDPRKIFELHSKGLYKIDFEDDRYSNCVEWNPGTDGAMNIGNAYAEGYSDLNNVVAVVGFEKADSDDLIQMKDARQDFYGLDRRGVRSFRGEVDQNRMRFINLRIPAHLMPEDELTEDEQDRLFDYHEAKKEGVVTDPVMVHRVFIAPTEIEYKKAA